MRNEDPSQKHRVFFLCMFKYAIILRKAFRFGLMFFVDALYIRYGIRQAFAKKSFRAF